MNIVQIQSLINNRAGVLTYDEGHSLLEVCSVLSAVQCDHGFMYLLQVDELKVALFHSAQEQSTAIIV